MRILKAFAFVAVAGALVAGSLQAQTGTGYLWSNNYFTQTANYGSNGTVYTSPYRAHLTGVAQNHAGYYLPEANTVYDIFCVDFVHHGQSYMASLSNLADPNTLSYTRLGNTATSQTKYLQAAWLASQLATHASDYGVINGAIWNIMGFGTNWVSGGSPTQSQSLWQLAAIAGGASVNASEWVVLTERTANGGVGTDGQEFIVHVTATPEPATLLLLGTGLLATLMAAGALRRSAV